MLDARRRDPSFNGFASPRVCRSRFSSPAWRPSATPNALIADRVLIGVSDRFSEKDLPLHISSNFPGSHACA
ncbi:hypothetical protein X945_5712 [Burkholderia pseudomallei ABCPW 107]|nr:hypothetical protein X945_5712 [Burkholderia pseudomallei ABCPW 107]